MGGHPKWKQRDMDDAQGASPAGKEQALWAAAEVLSQGLESVITQLCTPPLQIHTETITPGIPQNVTTFRDRIFKHVIKLK